MLRLGHDFCTGVASRRFAGKQAPVTSIEAEEAAASSLFEGVMNNLRTL